MRNYNPVDTEETVDRRRDNPKRRVNGWAPFWMAIILAALVLLILTLVFAILAWDNSKKKSPDEEKDACNSKDAISYGGDNENNTHWRYCSQINSETVSKLQLKCKLEVDGEISAEAAVDENGVAYFPTWNGTIYAVDIPRCLILWTVRVENLTLTPGDISVTTPSLTSNSNDGLIFGSGHVFFTGSPKAYVFRIKRSDGSFVWKTLVNTDTTAQVTGGPRCIHGLCFGGVTSNAYVHPALPQTFVGNAYTLLEETGAIVSLTHTIAGNVTAGAGVTGTGPVVIFENLTYCWSTGSAYNDLDVDPVCYAALLPGQNPQDCQSPGTLTDSVICANFITGDIIKVYKQGNLDNFNIGCVYPLLYPGFCPNITGTDEFLVQSPIRKRVMNPTTKAKFNVLGQGSKGGRFFTLKEKSEPFEELWSTTIGPEGVQGGLMFGSAADKSAFYVALGNSNHTNYILPDGSGTLTCGGAWMKLRDYDGKIMWATLDPDAAIGEEACADLQASPIMTSIEDTAALAQGKGAVRGINDVLFAPSLTGKMYAINTDNGEILWSHESPASLITPAATWKKYIFYGIGYTQFGVGLGGAATENHEFNIFSL